VTQATIEMGFQIFITPDDTTEPLTADRIRRDLLDLFMDEVMEFPLLTVYRQCDS
jgi:hypothetical protein